MKYYQLTYLVSPDLSEQEVKTFQKKINSLVQGQGGKIGKSEGPVKKKLASPVKEREKTYLANLDFYFQPEKLENLEKELKKESSLLRYLIAKKRPPKIKIPEIKPKLEPKIKKKKKVKLEKIEEKLDEILGEI